MRFVILALALLAPVNGLALLAPVNGLARAGEGPSLCRSFADLGPMLAKAERGDTVRLASGKFELNGPIRLQSGVRLIGAGQDQTQVVFRGKETAPLMIVDNGEDVEIAHLTLDGENNPLVRDGITGGNARRVFIHHLTIRNLGNGCKGFSHGIMFSGVNPSMERGVTDSVISDCRFENIGLEATYGGAIRLSWGSGRNRVERNEIHGTGRGGIFGDHAPELIIRNNRITGSGGEGLAIEIWGGCPKSLIEDNHVDHWISVDKGGQSAVRRNVVGAEDGSHKGFGIEIIASDVVVTDNEVRKGASIGLSVSNQDVKNNVFWGYNKVENCVQWGAQFQGDGGGIARHYLYRCSFAATVRGDPHAIYPHDSGHGFRINGNTRGMVFEDCGFRNNDGSAFQICGDNVDFLSFVRCDFPNNKMGLFTGLSPALTVNFVDCHSGRTNALPVPETRSFATAAPKVDFVMPAVIRAGEPTRFAAEVKSAGDDIVSHLWDFGDGIPGITANPEHQFEKPGLHRITLVVWNQAGRGARIEKRVDVQATARGQGAGTFK